MNKRWRNAGLYAFLAIAIITITNVIPQRIAFFDKQLQSRETWRYSDFTRAIEKGMVVKVEFSPDYTSALFKTVDGSSAIVNLPKKTELIDILVDRSVDVSVLPQTDKFKILRILFLAVLFSIYLFFLLRRAPVEKWRRNVELFAFVAIFVVVIVLVTVSFDKQPQSREICSYTYLIHAVKRGEVAEIKISHDNSKALVEFKNSSSYSSYDPRPLGVVTVYLPEDHSLLSQVLRQSNVTIDFSPQTIEDFWFKALGFLFSLLPLMRILLLGRSVSDLKSSISDLKSSISNLSSQVKDFDKSKAMVQEPQAQVTFKDVAGMDRAKLELKEVVDFLKNTDHFAADGTKIPQAILLAGSSGMDKTLLARAVAGEAGVPFLSISGSECVETFVGVGASRIRDLVEQAKSNVPCIVFIDEIDTVGGQRGAGLGSGNDMREQILNQLLTEMEGIKGKVGIIIIAATNRPDLLDLALLHSGRFDRQIVV